MAPELRPPPPPSTIDSWESLSFYLVLRVVVGVLYPSSGDHDMIKPRLLLELTFVQLWWAVPLLNVLPWSKKP